MFKNVLIFTLVLMSLSLTAQNTDQLIRDQISAMVENEDLDENFDFNTLYELYETLQENPFDLNRVTKEELDEIPFLSNIQVVELLDHRDSLGALNNFFELQSIPSFDVSIIKMLKTISYISTTVGQIQQGIRTSRDRRSELFIKYKRILEKQEGYTREDSTGYLGSPDHLYLRFRTKIGNKYQANIVAEKDNGEVFYYPKKIYGADYYSFHVAGKNITKKLKFLCIGDYAVSFGQGLLVHSGFGAGKSALTTMVRKGGYTLRPYSSVAEYNFLRGVSTKVSLSKNIENSLYISYKRREALVRNENDDDPFSEQFTSSLSESGYHRTIREIEKKDEISQLSVGNQLKYSKRRYHIALNAVYDQLSVPLKKNSRLYQLFGPDSDKFLNLSVDYGRVYRNFNFFGEIAYSNNVDIAQIHGVLMSLHKDLDLSVVYRNYGKKYFSLNANAFGESSNTTNEKGIYLGLEYRMNNRWIINAYADYWKNDWLKFRINAPSAGEEYFLRIKYYKKRKYEFYTQYFFERKDRNFKDKITKVLPSYKQRLRLHGAYKINKTWELRNRIEFSQFTENSDNQYGFLIYQDIIYKPVSKNFSFTTRYGYFDVKDYDARIYAFENDIINEYYIPAYNGRGLRFYFNARYRINRHLRLEARYGIYAMDRINDEPISAKNSIGSGLDEIEGNNKSTFKFQIRYKW